MDPPSHAAEMQTKQNIYFGYGSNLWRHQMSQRCPSSKYLGVARLEGYKWIIYERGYANIVKLDAKAVNNDVMSSTAKDKHDYSQEVWGLVYALQPTDEARLDRNEGVPYAYEKEVIECEFWAVKDENEDTDDGGVDPYRLTVEFKKAEKVKMLVYINHEETKESKSKKEYVYRMNMGIKDAIKYGVPEKYIEQVLRKYIPEKEDQHVRDVAAKQALEFEDET